MDFKQDLKHIIIKIFDEMDISFSDTESLRHLLLQYLNINEKLIIPEKRTVFYSDELQRQITSGNEQEHKEVIDIIKGKLERGEDINPHLSRRLFDASFNDGLLNEWAIYHFHLNTTKQNQSDYFIEGGKQLLFGVVDKNEVYFLCIGDHSDWTRKEFLDIVEENWPGYFQKQNRKLEAEPNQSPNDDEIKDLRKAGINLVANVDGKSVLPDKGGTSMSGDKMYHVLKAQNIIEQIEQLEKKVHRDGTQGEEQYKLKLKDETVLVVEQKTGKELFTLNIFPIPPMIQNLKA